jgi:hypothetical protein
MAFDRIMVWQFDTAPAWLRSLNDSLENPEWIVLVPREIYGADIDAMHTDGSSSAMCRYETRRGDVVYIGTTAAQPSPQMMAGSVEQTSNR